MRNMTRADLQILVDFHYWALARTLAAVESLSTDQFTRDLGGSFSSVRDTLSHLHGAEWIWLERFKGNSPTIRLAHERFPDLAAVRAAWAESETQLRSFVDSLDEGTIGQPIEYVLLNGQRGASRTDHMIQHVVNHATYHRGQVTTMLRQLGAAPPEQTDLIAFHRIRGDAR